MKNLQYLFTLLLFFSATMIISASNGNDPLTTSTDKIEVQSQEAGSLVYVSDEEARDCEVSVDVTLDDGTTVTGTITIHDISWIRCAAIHVADFFSGAF